jgi:hypothetical protein
MSDTKHHRYNLRSKMIAVPPLAWLLFLLDRHSVISYSHYMESYSFHAYECRVKGLHGG